VRHDKFILRLSAAKSANIYVVKIIVRRVGGDREVVRACSLIAALTYTSYRINVAISLASFRWFLTVRMLLFILYLSDAKELF